MPTFLIDGEEWMTIDLAAQILTAQNSREVTPIGADFRKKGGEKARHRPHVRK